MTEESYDWLDELGEPEGLMPLSSMDDETKRRLHTAIEILYQENAISFHELQAISNTTGMDLELGSAEHGRGPVRIQHAIPGVPPKPVKMDGGVMSDPIQILGCIFAAAGMAGSFAGMLSRVPKSTRLPDFNPSRYKGPIITGSGTVIGTSKIEELKKKVKDKVKPGGVLPTVAGATASAVLMSQIAPEVIEQLSNLMQEFAEKIHQYVTADLQAYLQSVKDWIQPLVEELRRLIPILQQIAHLALENLAPAMERLRNEVIEPYLKMVEESKPALDKLRADLERSGQTSDSTVPEINPPNITPEEAIQMSIALNLPIFGQIARGMLSSIEQQRYMQATRRGYGDRYRAWREAASGFDPVGSTYQALDDASQIPSWFL